MNRAALYLDEDVRVLLAEVLRSRGYRATHALEKDKCGRSDAEQLDYAVRHKMALLTHNVRDFLMLAKSYEAQGKAHYGIIVSGQLPFNELLKRTLKLLSARSGDSLVNKIEWLSDYK